MQVALTYVFHASNYSTILSSMSLSCESWSVSLSLSLFLFTSISFVLNIDFMYGKVVYLTLTQGKAWGRLHTVKADLQLVAF